MMMQKMSDPEMGEKFAEVLASISRNSDDEETTQEAQTLLYKTLGRILSYTDSYTGTDLQQYYHHIRSLMGTQSLEAT